MLKNAIATVLLLFVFSIGTNIYAQEAKTAINDAHVHLYNFIQETAGPAQLLEQMDQSHVDKAVILGMQVVKKWSVYEKRKPTYYLDDDSYVYLYSLTDALLYFDIKKLSAAQQKRFYPLLSGFDPSDMNAVDHVKRMITLFPNFWHGIGEVFLRHDDLTALNRAETPRANMKSMDAVYQLASRCHVPILMHTNISGVGISQPAYLHELVEALSVHPQTKVVLAHAGISRRIHVDNLTAILKDLLKQHNNLYIDLSWIVYPQEILDKNDNPKTEWLQLIEQFPERIMIGSDMVGSFLQYKNTIDKYRILLNHLKPRTAYMVGYKNADTIYKNTMASDCWK